MCARSAGLARPALQPPFLIQPWALDGTSPNGTVGAWYQGMDSTYPAWAGTGTANGGELEGQMTVGSSNGNMAWAEWCWATMAVGTATAADALASVGSNTGILNHEIAALGTKGSGATWVFSTTLTFS